MAWIGGVHGLGGGGVLHGSSRLRGRKMNHHTKYIFMIFYERALFGFVRFAALKVFSCLRKNYLKCLISRAPPNNDTSFVVLCGLFVF